MTASSTCSAGDTPVGVPVRLDRPRRDGVDPDIGREVARQRSGEAAHGALRRAVGDGDGVHHVLLVHAVAVGAREIDDGAATPRLHVRHDGAAHEEGALHVHREERIPGLRVCVGEAHRVRRVDPAGCVDQHVDAAVARHRALHEGLHRALVGDVEVRRMGRAAGGRDLVHGLGGCVGAAAIGQGHARPFARQRAGAGAAQRTARPGHDGDTAFESAPVVPATGHRTSPSRLRFAGV